LCLGTGNRIARAIDRTRVIIGELSEGPAVSERRLRMRQLERLQVRAQMLMKALRIFYAAPGSFAAAALVSVIGSALVYYEQRPGFRLAAASALGGGLSGWPRW
jgi:hypothetical protein